MALNQLEIVVLNPGAQPVTGASVTATADAQTAGVLTADYKSERALYALDDLSMGFYDLEVSHPNYVTQRRRIQVHPKPTRVTFMLSEADVRFTLQGNTQVPYASDPDEIGILPAPEQNIDVDMDAADVQTLRQLVESLNLEVAVDVDADAVGVEALGGLPPGYDGLVVRRPPRAALALTESATRDETRDELVRLRQSSLVSAAGPIFRRTRNAFSIFTNLLHVRFRPEAGRDQINGLLSEFGLSNPQPTGIAANLFLVEAPIGIGEGINQIAIRLSEESGVEYAEPQLAESPDLDLVTPTDFLWPGTWDRQLTGVDAAWELLSGVHTDITYGRPEIVIAVVDQGIESSDGEPANPDFQGTVSNGAPKTYQLYDFWRMRPGNDQPRGSSPSSGPGNHGVACAGVSCARADDSPLNSHAGTGAPGAAPNARVMGAIFDNSVHRNLQMFQWLCGLDSKSTDPGFPPVVSPGADVITCSIGFGAGALLSQAASDMLDRVTRLGRRGKGCLLFFSAGNDDSDIITYRPYGAHERTFSCAASTLDSAGNEIRASYSGWGDVEWCAPSHSDYPPRHDPPNHYSVWTADLRHAGNLPSIPLFTTTLAAPAAVGDTSIRVHDAHSFVVQSTIMIDSPGVHGGETVTVTGPAVFSAGTGTVTVPVSSLKHPHPPYTRVISGSRAVATLLSAAGVGDTSLHLDDVSRLSQGVSVIIGNTGSALQDRSEVLVTAPPDPVAGTVPITPMPQAHATASEVAIGHNHHRNNFGGTSSATPLSAGISALVLSANPKLTWVEAREILRSTAVKIDPASTHPTSQWLDENDIPCNTSGRPPVRSKGFGYGRLNAHAAVQAALEYRFTRDLMIRNTLTDDGTAATTPIHNSPDIWVRTTSPASDRQAEPNGYNDAGPHQDPVRGNQCWVYIRVRNRGTTASLDAWVRCCVASHQGSNFAYPDDFDEVNGLGNTTSGDWAAGTYLIGEVALPEIDAGDDFTIHLPWPAELIPPPATSDGESWNPHLLVEITPHDGPLDGTTLDNNNNLAAKSVSIAS